jgi:peptidoglycan/LPS O-acetylase OafA/YrhL
VRALPPLVALGVVAVALCLFDVRFAFGPTRLPYRAADIMIALGSALMIILVAARPAYDRALSRAPIAFLGRISYSFYLTHFPILLASASAVGRWPRGLWLAPPLALALALAVAWIAYRAVERPAQALGRALTGPAIASSGALELLR